MAKYAVRFTISVDVEDHLDITLLEMNYREPFKEEIAKKAKSKLYLMVDYQENNFGDLIEKLVLDDVWKFADG